MENSKDDNCNFVVEDSGEEIINVLSICWKMYIEVEWDKSYDTIM